MPIPFQDRIDAGRQLAARLSRYSNRPDVMVLGLARGGVPVAFEIARHLKAPLDVFLVRKLGVPGHEELAMGAIASGGVRVINEDVVRLLHIPQGTIDLIAEEEQRELDRRGREYREHRPVSDSSGQIVILVDDGLATGSTMRAAVKALRMQRPARIVVAVPVASPEAYDDLSREADEIECLATPEPFYAVGAWYGNFSQTTDEEIRGLLARDALVHAR